MKTYSQMTQVFLQQNNKQELARLEEEGTLDQFMNDVEELFGDQEQLIIRQMSKNLPDEYLERVRSLQQAEMVARETTTQDLTEFLKNL